ncbi:MAG TPA: radical SAM family heme chaperone HemW [Nitrospirota bacterium]
MLSLYIHIPFCVRKCPYCGFYSTPYSIKSADEFVRGLELEASRYKNDFSHRTFKSVYIGGGTPTTLSLPQLRRLLMIVTGHFRLTDDVEWTVEANPNSVTTENLGLLRDCGVNRLSLGMQSFSNDVLRILGRPHDAEQAVRAFDLARNAGFKNIGIDLIYGVPGQTPGQWEESLGAAIAMRPEHISAYGLSLDEGSSYYRDAERGKFALPDEDIAAALYERAVIMLRMTGYDRYEISNFSLSGFACRHNMNYWERGEYLGLGPGAWSFVAGKRWNNIADVAEYCGRLSSARTSIEAQEIVGAEPAAREAILLGLRTSKGLDLGVFEQTYGAPFLRKLRNNAAPLGAAGLLQETEGSLRLTDRGILLSNEALARLCV